MAVQDTEKQQVIRQIKPEKSGTFPIIGVGSSVGGLEALTRFFDAMPVPNGMAFIIVQHVRADTRTYLNSIIQSHTRMPVVLAGDRMKIMPDHVYVIPPPYNATLEKTAIRLSEKPDEPYIAHSIDFLFRSMAEELKDRAIGVILSGTGSDGTFGAKMINHRLGMIMVQSPFDARYGGMPESAINIGVADYVLTPGEMPQHLMEYKKNYFGKPAREREKDLASKSSELRELFKMAKDRTRLDMSIYKLATVYRRINRRMSLIHVNTIKEYIDYCSVSPDEITKLSKEFLIYVTAFFQQPEAFEALKSLLKEFMQTRPDGSEIHAWTMGCGSGEDTYSTAILIQECIEETGKHLNFRLFATDIDKDAINLARNGIYPASILDKDVTEERLKKYFVRHGSTYRVKEEIRRHILFSRQDFSTNPVFTKLGLITSRTVMIYLNARSQEKLIPIFYAALLQRGLLFPGTENSLTRYKDYFNLLDEKWKIYERK